MHMSTVGLRPRPSLQRGGDRHLRCTGFTFRFGRTPRRATAMKNPMTLAGKTHDLPLDRNDYWKNRAHHDLYRLTVATAQAMFSDARSAIDVGCYTSGLICELDWIEKRVASDISPAMVDHWAHVPAHRTRHRAHRLYLSGRAGATNANLRVDAFDGGTA